MSRVLQTWFVIVAMTVAPFAIADCMYPKAPQQIPDGKTASENQMMEAMTVFKQYNGDVNSYTACLEKETIEKVRDAAGATSAIVQIKSLQSKKHNAAVQELQEKAKQFNEEVRVFKSRK